MGKNSKILRFNCVNKVRCETWEEFNASIFSDVYRKALHLTDKIIVANHERSSATELEKFSNGNLVSNIIAFLGERGMGKSSAMLSYAFFLKKYDRQKQQIPPEYQFKSEENPKFYVLSKIDASMLSQDETLFDVVLAHMWEDFERIMQDEPYGEGAFQRTKRSFADIKDSYTRYYKETEKKEKRNIQSVKELKNLSKSLKLRENFASLVKEFLRSMIQDERVPELGCFLVIPIDDLDMVAEKSNDIWEQLQAFFTVPKIIILTTADLERAKLNKEKQLSEQLTGKLSENSQTIRGYVEAYFAKALPQNMRIYMPQPQEIKLSLDNRDMASLNELQTREDDDYVQTVDMIVAKLSGILTHKKIGGILYRNDTLRNIVNSVHEIYTIAEGADVEEEIYDYLRKKIDINGRNMTDRTDKEHFLAMLSLDMDMYNEYISKKIVKIEPLLMKNAGGDDKEEGYGMTLRALAGLLEQDIFNRTLVQQIVWFYSVRLGKCLKDNRMERLEEAYIQGNILDSALIQQLKGNVKDVFDISPVINFSITKKENVLETIEANMEEFVQMFHIMLFFDVEKILKDLKYEKPVKGSEPKDVGMDQAETKTVEADPYRVKITFTKVLARTSFDCYFRNMICYSELFEECFDWFCNLLCEVLNKKCLEDGERQALKERVKVSEQLKVTQWEDWKTDWNVQTLYDLLPVQSVGVMVEAVRRIGVLGEDWKKQDKDFGAIFEDLIHSLVTVFGEAEEYCECEKMKNNELRYSLKLQELFEIVNLKGVSSEKMDKMKKGKVAIEDTATGA